MATGRVPTTANSPLTAKGDLFGYSTAPARLAVGNDGEQIVADSSATTGLRYQGSMAAGKNAIINGGMDIWQRGTSISAVGSTSNYTADRWLGYNSSSAFTISRQATGDTTNLPNIQYCGRIQRNSGATATTYMYLSQSFETVNSIPFAGKTVTYSFYARKGTDFSDGTSVLRIGVNSGTGTDQNWLVSYTGDAAVIAGTTLTLTTTWQRFTYTGTVATTAKELTVWFEHRASGTAGANDYYEITGLQLELGSVATAFARNSGTIQGELAACMRYYQKSYNQSVTPATVTEVGSVSMFTQATVSYNFLPSVSFGVRMRATPTITVYSTATGTSAKIANIGGVVDVNATVVNIGEAGFTAIVNNVSIAGGNELRCQWRAEIEL